MWIKVQLAHNGVFMLVNLANVENIAPTAVGLNNPHYAEAKSLITFISWDPDGNQSAVYVKESFADLEFQLMQAPCKPSTS